MFDGFETEFEKWLEPDYSLGEIVGGLRDVAVGAHGSPGEGWPAVIGAVIIRHKLCLSDEETIGQIRENP